MSSIVNSAVSSLMTVAKVQNNADVDVEKMISILNAPENKEELWQPESEFIGQCISKAAEKVLEEEGEEGERFVKGWVIVQHNSMGKEQERLLLATTKAMYRVNFIFSQQKVKKFERMPWTNVQLITYGQFEYSKGMIPSVADFLLASGLNALYGLRVFTKEKPSAPPPVPFLVEKFVDKCFRTYRPIIPEDSDNAEALLHNVTQEIVAVCLTLLRVECTDLVPTHCPCSETSISVNATRGLIAAIHNKGNMGVQKKREAEDGADE